MGIFDKFKLKRSAPTGYSPVNIEFTQEESEAISRTLNRYAAIANADAPSGMVTVFPQKVRDGMTAQGLTEYVEDLMRRLQNCGTNEEIVSLMDKAIKAQMKVYAIHNLPVYLFQLAGMFELIGDEAKAREFFHLFIRAQNDFKADDVDDIFIHQTGLDMRKAITLAKEKIQ